ncbi:calcium-activated chloride channel-domain-containing protein [Pavlovales sp. CCMP2436]|nr:calcium-activated chloride channel-domain-containing protein [Pavlovales sp. CCMP2436]
MAFSTLLVLCAMAANLTFRLWLVKHLPRDGPILGGLATGVSIQVLGTTFKYVAAALTEWECWRTDTQHEDALIAKVFVFEVVNNYSSLFYLAFFGKVLGKVVGVDVPTSEACNLYLGKVEGVDVPTSEACKVHPPPPPFPTPTHKHAHTQHPFFSLSPIAKQNQLGKVVGVDVPTSEACDRGSECLYDLEFQLGSILFAKCVLEEEKRREEGGGGVLKEPVLFSKFANATPGKRCEYNISR